MNTWLDSDNKKTVVNWSKGYYDSLAVLSTEEKDALSAFRVGLDYFNRVDFQKDNLELAVDMFERAVDIDTAFMLAYCLLSKVHSALIHFGYDPSEERLELAKNAIERAKTLKSGDSEVNLAFGWYYYWGLKDLAQAIQYFEFALDAQPVHAEAYLGVGAAYRRLGRFRKAADYLKRAFKLAPDDGSLARQIGATYMCLREYGEAERYYNLAISLAPDQVYAYINKAGMLVLGDGDIASAREVLEDMPRTVHFYPGKDYWDFEILARNYEAAVKRVGESSQSVFEQQEWYYPKSLLIGLAYGFSGNEDSARVYLDSARIHLEVKAKICSVDHRVASALGLAYAGLGLKDKAISEGLRGVSLLTVAQDAMVGPERVKDLARIYTMVGEYDKAVEQIEYLLEIPYWLSIPLLRIDPQWDLLREHPGFQELLEL